MREEFKKWNLFKDFNELLYFAKGPVSTIQMRVIIFCFCFFISIWFIWLFLFWFSFILIGISICQGLNLRCSEEIWRFRFPTINNYMHPWSAATILLPRTKIKDISCTTLYQMFIFIYFFFFPFFLLYLSFSNLGLELYCCHSYDIILVLLQDCHFNWPIGLFKPFRMEGAILNYTMLKLN